MKKSIHLSKYQYNNLHRHNVESKTKFYPSASSCVLTISRVNMIYSLAATLPKNRKTAKIFRTHLTVLKDFSPLSLLRSTQNFITSHPLT